MVLPLARSRIGSTGKHRQHDAGCHTCSCTDGCAFSHMPRLTTEPGADQSAAGAVTATVLASAPSPAFRLDLTLFLLQFLVGASVERADARAGNRG